MARGWESKSVEEQQAEQQAASQQPTTALQTDAERRRRQELESLRLMRARIQQQLAAARDERYAAQLRTALAEIEKKLAAPAAE